MMWHDVQRLAFPAFWYFNTGFPRRRQSCATIRGRNPWMKSGSFGPHPFQQCTCSIFPEIHTQETTKCAFRSDALASFLSRDNQTPSSSLKAGILHGNPNALCLRPNSLRSDDIGRRLLVCLAKPTWISANPLDWGWCAGEVAKCRPLCRRMVLKLLIDKLCTLTIQDSRSLAAWKACTCFQAAISSMRLEHCRRYKTTSPRFVLNKYWSMVLLCRGLHALLSLPAKMQVLLSHGVTDFIPMSSVQVQRMCAKKDCGCVYDSTTLPSFFKTNWTIRNPGSVFMLFPNCSRALICRFRFIQELLQGRSFSVSISASVSASRIWPFPCQAFSHWVGKRRHWEFVFGKDIMLIGCNVALLRQDRCDNNQCVSPLQEEWHTFWQPPSKTKWLPTGTISSSWTGYFYLLWRTWSPPHCLRSTSLHSCASQLQYLSLYPYDQAQVEHSDSRRFVCRLWYIHVA